MSKVERLYEDLLAYLCPAGEGIYAVSTGKQYKNVLQQLLYGSTDHDQRLLSWQEHLKKLPLTEKPLLLGVCSDVGGGISRGANWGPVFVRQKLYEHINSTCVFDLGDIRVIPHLLLD